MTANWKLFKKWEIEEKGRHLRSFTPEKALAIFEELYLLQETIPLQELERLRQRRLKNVINWRKVMDSLKGKLR